MMKVLMRLTLLIIFISGMIYVFKNSFSPSTDKEELPVAYVERKNFNVDIKVVGELEAARSTIIASSIKGDLGKIIYLITDGVYVKPGDLLVKMDPTPFEEKIEKLKGQIKEQEGHVASLKQAFEWEQVQAEHENKSADFEIETAELELLKIKHGDGPLEQSRLKSAMQKAWLKYDELKGYTNDLMALEQEGYLNPGEKKQAEKKLIEEQEAYETAKMQYESYVNHSYPMQIKKAETALKRAKIKQEETIKNGSYRIAKAFVLLEQTQQVLGDYLVQMKQDQKELDLTEIYAPSPGMVVQREEFRSSMQKRKPRIGDILVKNQPLIELPDLDSMIVKTKVREIDLFKIEVGKKATVEVDAYPQLSFSGKVSSIGILAMADLARASEEKYFEVRIALDQGDNRLRPGMTTRATIHACQIQDQLVIPIQALFEEDKKHYCYVVQPEGYEKRFIEVGFNNEHWLEVKAGLNEKEQICLINPLLANIKN